MNPSAHQRILFITFTLTFIALSKALPTWVRKDQSSGSGHLLSRRASPNLITIDPNGASNTENLAQRKADQLFTIVLNIGQTVDGEIASFSTNASQVLAGTERASKMVAEMVIVQTELLSQVKSENQTLMQDLKSAIEIGKTAGQNLT